MADKKELVIRRGEEFKLFVKDNIDESDIFYEQYEAAARMLDDILDKQNGQSVSWGNMEYENNVIAFCGERGEGKSSAMISFVKAAYEYHNYNTKSPIFKDCENVKQAYFIEPILIDPSMLDGVHNVLDIILATLFKKFKDKYEKDNQFLYRNDREKLLDQFQKVYKRISVINDQKKMLDDEYDYEGNISKLMKLGQSTELRNELEKLIELYIETMWKEQGEGREKGNKILLIAIDDLDLCSSHVYKMTEQIRKYLMIPGVVVLMAIRVEQLELCVREKNIGNYENIVKYDKLESGILEEINNMSERYVAKLIPKARRNYLPNIRTIEHLEIIYWDRGQKNILGGNLKDDSAGSIILNLIYQKTGMMFLQERTGKNYFLPDNLRDMVNVITLLADMEEPGGDSGIYYRNIEKFFAYFEKQWLFSNFSLEDSREIQKLVHKQSQFHEDVAFLLYQRYNLTKKKGDSYAVSFLPDTPDSYFVVMNWLESYRTNVFGEDERKYASMFRILYTIRLNELLRTEKKDEWIKFIGGYIWAGNFQNVLPNVQDTVVDRSRFMLSTFQVYYTIAQDLYEGKNFIIPKFDENKQYYIRVIAKDDEYRKYKIVIWTLLGILSNTYVTDASYRLVYTFDTTSIVYTNYSVLPKVHISLENYIVSLCSLDSLYGKVNMEYLGIDKEEFQFVIKEIQESNKEIIACFEKIISNLDIAMEFKEYCRKRSGIRESGKKDEIKRTQEIVNRFFRNVRDFAEEHFAEEQFISGLDKCHCLKLAYDTGKTEIDISYLYALLVQAGLEESGQHVNTAQTDNDRENLVKDFAAKLRDRSKTENSIETVSGYLITKTAQNFKKNMDSLASNIQRYYSINREENLNESEILELCDFYGKIIDQYVVEPSVEISEDLSEEYKRLVKKYKKTNE